MNEKKTLLIERIKRIQELEEILNDETKTEEEIDLFLKNYFYFLDNQK